MVVEGEAAVLLAGCKHWGAQDGKLGCVAVCRVKQKIGSYGMKNFTISSSSDAHIFIVRIKKQKELGHFRNIVFFFSQDLFITVVLASGDPNIHHSLSSTRLSFCSRAYRWTQAIVQLWNKMTGVRLDTKCHLFSRACVKFRSCPTLNSIWKQWVKEERTRWGK